MPKATTYRRVMGGLAAGAATLAVAAGCGESTIDAAKIEDAINADVKRANLQSQVKSVECPENEPSKTDHRFDCKLNRTDGKTEDIPVLVTDGEKGSVKFGTEAQ